MPCLARPFVRAVKIVARPDDNVHPSPGALECYLRCMWVHPAVCKLVAMNLSSFAASVGSRPLIFAASVGLKATLFASPSDLVCGPLQVTVVGPAEGKLWCDPIGILTPCQYFRFRRLHWHFYETIAASPPCFPEIGRQNYRFSLLWEMCPEIMGIPQDLSEQGPKVYWVVSHVPFRRSFLAKLTPSSTSTSGLPYIFRRLLLEPRDARLEQECLPMDMCKNEGKAEIGAT